VVQPDTLKEVAVKVSDTKVSKPVLVTNKETGNIERYKSIVEAAKSTKVSPNTFRKYLSSGELLKGIYSVNVEINNDSVKRLEDSAKKTPKGMPVIIKNNTTGQVVRYLSKSEASKSTGVSMYTINKHMGGLDNSVCYLNLYPTTLNVHVYGSKIR
jgi:Fic family protein